MHTLSFHHGLHVVNCALVVRGGHLQLRQAHLELDLVCRQLGVPRLSVSTLTLS